MLVEPACAAALAAVLPSSNLDDSNDVLRVLLRGKEGERETVLSREESVVVVVVCGGSNVDLEAVEKWKKMFGI